MKNKPLPAGCARVNGGPRLTSARHVTNRRQERPNKSGDESIRITTAQSVMNGGGGGEGGTPHLTSKTLLIQVCESCNVKRFNINSLHLQFPLQSNPPPSNQITFD